MPRRRLTPRARAGLAGALVLAAGLAAHHAWLAPALALKDGASRAVCCFDARAGVLQVSADGAWAVRGAQWVDLRRGEVVPEPSAGARLRAPWTGALNSASAWFGSEAQPRRVARFVAAQPLAVHLGDGTEVALANPNGNCVVLADDGPVAAVVVSKPERAWHDALLPLRAAGTIDFVDLRSGRTLRSVTVARLDGFACQSGRSLALVGTAGGARWVLAQERWLKIFDVRLPQRSREPSRALAQLLPTRPAGATGR